MHAYLFVTLALAAGQADAQPPRAALGAPSGDPETATKSAFTQAPPRFISAVPRQERVMEVSKVGTSATNVAAEGARAQSVRPAHCYSPLNSGLIQRTSLQAYEPGANYWESCHNDNRHEGGFLRRLCGIYWDEFFANHRCKMKCHDDHCGGHSCNGNGCQHNPCNGNACGGHTGCPDNGNGSNGDDSEAPRRALPAPFNAPPFPTAEYQGFPLIGVPRSDTVYPLMQALYGEEEAKQRRVQLYGWINASGNWSTSTQSNTPSSYWVKPNALVLDQAVLRLERQLDTVQQDHIDWGFRLTGDYGIDYRYFTAGGWGSDQLLVNNRLYGWDPTEVTGHIYFPGIAEGMILTFGRWIATPDIETQFGPDNYMGTHSLQFTVDVYTQTGVMATIMLNPQWTVQAAIHAGADMAPWYEGAVPTGMFGVRWVSEDNNDSFYTVLNAINNAEYQYFDVRGVPAGHHNYNIIQSTWQHRFSKCALTKTEAYYMWERNAPVGGTPSIGPFQHNSGGGLGATVPGLSSTYGVLNYTAFQLSDNDFVVFRNEWMKDENGTRYDFAGNFTSHSIGLTHHFNPLFLIRPEIGYYRNWDNLAFDNGQKKGMWLYGFDMILRF